MTKKLRLSAQGQMTSFLGGKVVVLLTVQFFIGVGLNIKFVNLIFVTSLIYRKLQLRPRIRKTIEVA